MSRRDMLLAATVASLWGFNFVVIDWGMHGVPPLLFVAIRFAVVSLAALVVPRPLVSWRVVLGVGAFMSLGQFALLYTAIGLGLQPGLAALLLQAQAVLTIVVAALALRERPNRAQVAGVVTGSVGLGVVALGRGGNAPALAVVLCLLAALSWAVGNVIARRAGAASPSGWRGSLSLTVWSSLIVPLPALALSALLDGPAAITLAIGQFGWRPILSTLYTAVLCTLVGYAIFNRLLATNRSAAVVPWVLLAPVVAMISASVLLGQRPNVWETVGGLTLVLGVLFANLPVGRAERPRVDPHGAPPLVPDVDERRGVRA